MIVGVVACLPLFEADMTVSDTLDGDGKRSRVILIPHWVSRYIYFG